MSHEIALSFKPTHLWFDIDIEAGDLVSENGLRTAVILSLFSDATAEPGDAIADGSENRRGWWADTFSEVQNDRFGSRLWLLHRSKVTNEVLEAARAYSAESLRWLVDDRIARKVEVNAEAVDDNILGLEVVVFRENEPPVRFSFSDFWSTLNAV